MFNSYVKLPKGDIIYIYMWILHYVYIYVYIHCIFHTWLDNLFTTLYRFYQLNPHGKPRDEFINKSPAICGAPGRYPGYPPYLFGSTHSRKKVAQIGSSSKKIETKYDKIVETTNKQDPKRL